MRTFYIMIFLAATTLFMWLVATNQISVTVFTALETTLFFTFFILFVGPDNVSEMTLGRWSIKHDVKVAKEIREEVQKIRDELKDITKLTVENNFITGNTGLLPMGSDPKARKRLEDNIDKLSKIVEPDNKKEDRWWEELQALFPGRQKHKD